jgi:hypothetical protein
MIPGEVEEDTWLRLRQGVSWAAKAAVAIGALAWLAQYVSGTTLDRAALRRLVSHGSIGTPTTGAGAPRPKLAGAPAARAGIDQAPLSYASQVSRQTPTRSAEADR